MSIIITLNHEIAADKKHLRQLILRGGYDYRFNASYFSVEDIKMAALNLFESAEEHGDRIRIIVDLPGAKRRIGVLPYPSIQVKKFQKYYFQVGITETSNQKIIPIPEDDFLSDLIIGDILTLKDGKIKFLITNVHYEKKLIETECLTNGQIVSHIGYSFLKKSLPSKGFPQKNYDILDQLSAEFTHAIAISYAEHPELLNEISSRINKDKKKSIKIISKIETPTGIQNLYSLAASSDSVWFCRGDLVNFIRPENLYEYEKIFLDNLPKLGIPAYVAGENLYGFVTNAFPSRAELAHLGYLYERGIQGIVLSDETAESDSPEDIFLLAQKIERKYKKHDPKFISK